MSLMIFKARCKLKKMSSPKDSKIINSQT